MENNRYHCPTMIRMYLRGADEMIEFQYQPLCERLLMNGEFEYEKNISIPAPLRGASAIAYNKRHAILFDHNNFAQIIVNHAIITPNNWRYNHRNVLHFDENLPVQSCTPPVLLLFPYERRIFRNISPNILRHQLCL